MAAKPTILFGVPRVFNRIHDKIKERVESLGCILFKIFYITFFKVAKKALFNKALEAKLKDLRKGPFY